MSVMVLSNIIIYCDGACLYNPGPGGFAALLLLKGQKEERVISGLEFHTTNNRMELRAAIEGLRGLKRKCRVEVYSDSQYVVKGMTEWIKGWQRTGFKNAQKKDIVNKDLWQDLLQIANEHVVTWHWVRGHSGDELNERVDEIAREQAALALHQLRKSS